MHTATATGSDRIRHMIAADVAAYRGWCAAGPPITVHPDGGQPVPPPGPEASDEEVEAYITGLCRHNPNM